MRKLILTLLSIASICNLNAQMYFVSTVAGNGMQGLVDGSAVTTAQLNWPYGVAYDGDSIIYFADGANHSIRKLNILTSNVSTIAGNGTSGLQNGIGSSARFNFPDDVFYKNGYLYIGDNMNNCIRQIDLSSNMVTTFAGTGVAGYLDGPANQAMFQGGNGIAVAVDKNNDVYVADGTNACVRKISNGQVSTVAGSPGFGYLDGPASQAKFHRPRYLALDTVSGDLFITDINNNVIRKLSSGMVSTFSGTGVAGGTDGAYNVATFSAPVGIAMTAGGYFYVIDGGGNKLRKIDSSGTVTTIAGNGNFGFQDGPAASAEFYYPQDVCYDKDCYIYIADRNNNRIRRVIIPEGNNCAADINDLLSEEINLNPYPNPNSGTLTIEIENNSMAFYSILNSLGQEVKSGKLISAVNNIPLLDLSNGIYNIVVSQHNKIVTGKISLQK